MGEQQRQEGGPARADEPAPDDPGPAEPGAARDRQAAPPGDLVVGDDVHVEVGPGVPGDGGADAGPEDVLPGPAARGAQDDLGGVDPARELQEGDGDLVADDAVVRAAEVFDEGALGQELLRRGRAESVAARDVHGEHLPAGALLREPGGPADQRAPLGAAGQPDDDALARPPDRGDAVVAAVLLQVFVDPVGDPQQGQFAQRREVARAEVVGEGGVDLVRLVDVAVGHAAAQCLRRHVDELDLVGAPHHLVRDGLPLAHAGYRRDDVAQRLQVLDVDGRHDVDAGGQQLLDVLPAPGIPRSRHVRVRELVDQCHRGASGQDGVDVHFGEGLPAVFQFLERDPLETAQHRFGARPAVVLGERDDAVGTALQAAVCLGQHGVGLADAGGGAEVNP